jgi:hypothetical protein
MVAVLMREQNTIKRSGIHSKQTESQIELLGTETCIDQQTHASALDYRRVPTTPTSKNCKSNHLKSLQIPHPSRKRFDKYPAVPWGQAPIR